MKSDDGIKQVHERLRIGAENANKLAFATMERVFAAVGLT
jgi:hypothetical protein